MLDILSLMLTLPSMTMADSTEMLPINSGGAKACRDDGWGGLSRGNAGVSETNDSGQFATLAASNEKDRGAVRTAMTRWPGRWKSIDDSKKAGFVDGLVEANDVARKCLHSQDSDTALAAAGTVASIVRTAAMMEAQNQQDYWSNDKNERLDAGKATERVGAVDVQFG